MSHKLSSSRRYAVATVCVYLLEVDWSRHWPWSLFSFIFSDIRNSPILALDQYSKYLRLHVRQVCHTDNIAPYGVDSSSSLLPHSGHRNSTSFVPQQTHVSPIDVPHVHLRTQSGKSTGPGITVDTKSKIHSKLCSIFSLKSSVVTLKLQRKNVHYLQKRIFITKY